MGTEEIDKEVYPKYVAARKAALGSDSTRIGDRANHKTLLCDATNDEADLAVKAALRKDCDKLTELEESEAPEATINWLTMDYYYHINYKDSDAAGQVSKFYDVNGDSEDAMLDLADIVEPNL